MSTPLELQGITRHFGGVPALRDVGLIVRPGTVHALLGENGAGKTTLMRIAFGMLRPEAGTIQVHGREVHFRSPRDALASGIGMVHQHFTLVPAMTVAENIALGGSGRYDATLSHRRVDELALRTGLPVHPGALVRDLSVAEQQRVEILKALVRETQVLILDEPTAVLAPTEIKELLSWVRAFPRVHRAVVLITHKLREAIAVADDVTVLRAGRITLSAPASEVDETRLVSAMIGAVPAGSTVSDVTPLAPPGAVVLDLANVTATDASGRTALRGATVSVRSGELVGIAAVEGSGHHELLRILAGRRVPSSGSASTPPDVAFIPEDRHRDAVVLDFSLTENLALRGLGAQRGRLPWGIIADRARRIIERYDVRAPGPTAAMRTLSGGNQQKFLVGREFDPLPIAVIAENPTRGLDINATAAVHERLRSARAAGAAVVVYSSDVDEVLALSDRVFVVHAGRVLSVPNERDAVARAMLGVTP